MTEERPRFATDVVRTKSFDSSANLTNQSLTVKEYMNIYSPFATIDRNSYCTPFDRVGTNYTTSCTGLTMKECAKIAFALTKKETVPKKHIVGVSLAATAPDAFNASSKIIEIALSETGKMPPKRVKLPPQRPLPQLGSPQAKRETMRLNRSQPNYSVVIPHDGKRFR
jgi:hypothetical protein